MSPTLEKPLPVLVIIGTHPDEWANYDPALLALINGERHIEGVEVVVANEEGFYGPPDPVTGLRERLLQGENLSMSWPGSPEGSPAQQRAWQLAQLIARSTIAIDIHSTREKGAERANYGSRANREVRQAAGYLGLKESIIYDNEDGPLFRHHNLFTIEFAPEGSLTVESFVGKLPDMVAGVHKRVRTGRAKEHEWISDLAAADVIAHGLPEELEPFKRLPRRAWKKLGLPPDTVPVCWSKARYDKPTNGLYWGELVVPRPRTAFGRAVRRMKNGILRLL
jgi:hypothetical protein